MKMSKDYDKNYNNKLDYLIPKVSKNLTTAFNYTMLTLPEIQGSVNTSPFMNMMVASYLTSLTHVLEILKKSTIGEIELIKNIEMMQSKLINMFEELPFVKGVAFKEIK
jgi:hypothetical protein